MSTQLTFKWEDAPSYAASDYMVSKSNQAAIAFMEMLPLPFPEYAALLYGQQGAGKTHLAKCLQEKHHALLIDHALLGSMTSENLIGQHHFAILDDIQTLQDETAFFHLLRYMETSQRFLLLISSQPAKSLPFTLPDLRSRLLSFSSTPLPPPDDALLHLMVTKWFSDHQLAVSTEVIHYLITRSPRAFNPLRQLLTRIAALSLETKREITIPLVKRLLT